MPAIWRTSVTALDDSDGRIELLMKSGKNARSLLASELEKAKMKPTLLQQMAAHAAFELPHAGDLEDA
jgi:hypothetical protein